MQRLCIIASAKEPDFIIFLPTFYLPSEKPGTKDVNKEQVSVAPFRPEWMLHPVPAFPGELTLFVRPIVQLGAALENMIAYAKQEAQWLVSAIAAGEHYCLF